MGFFGSVDSISLLEDNAKKIRTFDEETSTKLTNIFKRVRNTLRNRLQSMELTGILDTFTSQQNRAILLQIEMALRVLEGRASEQIEKSVEEAAYMGVEHLQKEVDKMSEFFTGTPQPLNLNVAEVVTNVSNFRINQFQSSIGTYSSAVRAALSTKLSEVLVTPTPANEVVALLQQGFDAQEWRVRRIARTETQSVYGEAKLEGMDQTPGMKKTLYHPMDSRTSKDSIFLTEHATKMIKEPKEPFDYWWSSKNEGSFTGPTSNAKWYHRVFQTIDRPNDRSIVIPYREEWDTSL